MSSQIYPVLRGLTFNVIRSYVWKSISQEAVSGKETAIGMRQYPRVHFELNYEMLLDRGTTSEIKSVVGLHNQMKGRVDTFLFTDPDFNAITSGTAAQYGQFGTGDGSTLIFQLVALYQNSGGPGQPEIIQNLNGAAVLYDNGAAISAANYTIGATGIVTFGSGHAPASGHALTWSGSFYYRCRFDDDAISWKKETDKWWTAEVHHTSVKL